MIHTVEFFETPLFDAGITGDFGSHAGRADDLEFRIRFGGHCKIDAWEEGGKVCLIRRGVSKRIDVHLRTCLVGVMTERRDSRRIAVFRVEVRRE